MSNAPWALTGYGTQTAAICQYLKADGHQVAIAANYGLGAAAIDWNGIPVFPQGSELYSNDLAPAHVQYWSLQGPVWVISLYDVWVFQEQAWANTPRIASWTPVDHSPVPPQVLNWASKHPTIAMSRFGQRELANGGVESTYIPHGVDCDIFKPTQHLRNGKTGREIMNIPEDAFVVMINAANKGTLPSRKAFPEMFMALGRMMKQHSDVFAYLHTEPRSQYGIDLAAVLEAAAVPGERVRFVDQYALRMGLINGNDMAALYSAADVLLQTSRGEGFGIPAVEAQACGTPIIVSNFSSQPELLGAGWLVDGQKDYDPGLQSFYMAPDIGEIAAALEDAYNAKGNMKLAEQARSKALEYHAPKVYDELWRPYIASLAEQLIPLQPNRAQRRAAKKR